MHQSHIFTKTRREAPSDEVSKNAQLLIRAGFVHKELAGVYSYLPLGLLTLNNIARIVREEMNALGAEEILMSALHPIENYEKTQRENIDVLFHTELSAGGKLVLGQSHEEIVVPLIKEYISSYRDLPRGVYQIQTKFRNEARAKSGIMRGREFLMKDLYSFHASEEDFEAYYTRAAEAYLRIFARVGIGGRTYKTFASGGTFSKYSHEFQTETDAGEDTIYLCSACRVGINDEIIAEQEACPECGKAKAELVQKKTIEVGNIFPLKTRFSDAFHLTFRSEEGSDVPVIMGCYGIGIGRVMGAIVEVLADEKGLLWPREVAPFLVHLVVLDGGDGVLKKEADALYEMLRGAGITVLYDDRDVRAGEKFADADLLGMPVRIVVGKQYSESNLYEVRMRAGGAEERLTKDALLPFLKSSV